MKSALVIEDDFDIRMTLKELLESEGFVVHLAENGQEGLTCLAKLNEMPKIILLDLYMPVMDGAAFLKEIKSQFPILSGIPILIMTAAAVGEYPAGISPEYILKKPLEIDELFSKIEQFL